MIFGSTPSSIPRACPLRKPMRYLCCMTQVTNCSSSTARSSGSRLNLPGITTSTRTPSGSDSFESLMLRNGLFTGIRMQPTAFHILHTVEPCRGHEHLRSDVPQLLPSTISVDAFGSLSLTFGTGIG